MTTALISVRWMPGRSPPLPAQPLTLCVPFKQRGCTALNIAAEAGITDNMEWLMDKGANVNWRNLKRQTPLYAAASKNRYPFELLCQSCAQFLGKVVRSIPPIAPLCGSGYGHYGTRHSCVYCCTEWIC